MEVAKQLEWLNKQFQTHEKNSPVGPRKLTQLLLMSI